MTEKDPTSAYRAYVAGFGVAVVGLTAIAGWSTWARVTSAAADGIDLGPTLTWTAVGFFSVAIALYSVFVFPTVPFLARTKSDRPESKVFVARRMPESQKAIGELFGESFDLSYLFAVVSTAAGIEIRSQKGESRFVVREDISRIASGTSRVGALDSPCVILHATVNSTITAIPLLCRESPWLFFIPPRPSSLKRILADLDLRGQQDARLT